mmetsp:Transcript_5400/g.7937  ORF Transcript_5400/g.7937 Transcript_5400/m.7937 type:complete len:85 (+) Transcript_5400:346-600(+)
MIYHFRRQGGEVNVLQSLELHKLVGTMKVKSKRSSHLCKARRAMKLDIEQQDVMVVPHAKVPLLALGEVLWRVERASEDNQEWQ